MLCGVSVKYALSRCDCKVEVVFPNNCDTDSIMVNKKDGEHNPKKNFCKAQKPLRLKKNSLVIFTNFLKASF